MEITHKFAVNTRVYVGLLCFIIGAAYFTHGEFLMSFASEGFAAFPKDGPKGYNLIALYLCALAYLFWIIFKTFGTFIVVSKTGVTDGRIYDREIPWSKISSVKHKINGGQIDWNDAVHIEVEQSFIVKDLGDRIKSIFAVGKDNGAITIKIKALGLGNDFYAAYDAINKGWENAYEKVPEA